MDLVGLISLLMYTFGAFTFAALLALWLRGAPRSWAIGQLNLVEGALSVVTLVWFALNLLFTLSPIIPGLNPNFPQLAIFAVAFLYPALIQHVFSRMAAQPVPAGARLEDAPTPGSGTESRPRGWAVTLGTLYVVGTVMALAILAVAFWWVLPAGGPSPGDAETVNRFLDSAGIFLGLLLAVGLGYGFRGFTRSRKCHENASERTRRLGMRGIIVVMIGLSAVIVLGNMGVIRFDGLLRTVLYSTPLLVCFGSVYLTDRYTFFDLFIKRGLCLLLTILVLTTYLAVLLPMLEGVDFAWAEPWVYALALLPVAVALPWLYRRVWSWVDAAWLGRRFTTVEAVKQFLSSMQQATSAAQLIDRAELGISTIFRAPTRIDVTSDPRASEPFDSTIDIPIHDGSGRVGVMRLGRRAGGTPFFSEDRSLLTSLADVFAHMFENTRLQEREQAQERRAKELSLQASRSDLKALRAQINPHFLFNALNAIAGLIHKDPGRADRTVEQLAEVFRYTLRRSEREWAPLEDEIEFVRAYLDVEQARFGRRLECRVTLDAAVTAAAVPTMMVQTLVENAVKHGVAAVRGVGQVVVDAYPDDDGLRIRVADNGPGFGDRTPAVDAGGSSYGLKNIRERLRGYYGDRAALTLERDDQQGLTVAAILLPWTADAGTGVVKGDPLAGVAAEPR